MNNHLNLLQLDLYFYEYKFALLCFITAFVVTLMAIPPIISLVKRFNLFDLPNSRKEHATPIPTMGGIAIMSGMVIALALWFPFEKQLTQVCFFFSMVILFSLGIFDDLKDLSARYKFIIQIGLASLIAIAGIRITSFEGLFGIYELAPTAQYTITIVAITGITNAFNLIDGIDGLAGGLGFMSLVTLGFFLTLNGDGQTALVAFALAGAILAFLYFNFNPAKIFMGDTGSLVIGFVIAVLSIRFMQVNSISHSPIMPHAAVFIAGIVLIPVFDTLRVFATRIWKGKSPFSADKTHIHHLLTRQGFTHGYAAKIICFLHAFILIETYWLRMVRQELVFLLLFIIMLCAIAFFRKLGHIKAKFSGTTLANQVQHVS
jgi:UDP-GlcNAc:undecaprenyl-phosphate GlcNAc-1-phosphate transferase